MKFTFYFLIIEIKQIKRNREMRRNLNQLSIFREQGS